jgi:hypothetical protein
MTFYKVWYFTRLRAGRGYAWRTSRVEAQRAIAAWKREQRAVEPPKGVGHAWGTVEVVYISPTKKGILAALNEHACHDVTEQ